MADLHLKGVPAFLAGTDPSYAPDTAGYIGVDAIYRNAANAIDDPLPNGSQSVEAPDSEPAKLSAAAQSKPTAQSKDNTPPDTKKK